MIRVVLDTNVIVSAYLNQDGLPFLILKLALADVVRPYASEPILAEYEELLLRKSYPLDKRRARLLQTPTPMLRDDDEFDDPGYTCPVCRRSFSSFSSLDDHMVQHRGQRQCHQCGKQLRDDEYHRC